MSRRTAIAAAVEVHNRAHPTARLPRPGARLLTVMSTPRMFAASASRRWRQRGFGKSLPQVLHALVEAGFVTRQPGTSRSPDTYRLRTLMIGEAP
jgi:hypothetical protein